MASAANRMPTGVRTLGTRIARLERDLKEVRAARRVEFTLGGSFTRQPDGSTAISAQSFTADSTVRSGFFKTTSPVAHAVTIFQASTTGVDTAAALNVVSNNRETSAMFLSGTETNRGSLKVAHHNPGPLSNSDASASALSIDLQDDGNGIGTAAQGIFITSTTGATTGNLLTMRNNGRDDFVVRSTGQVGIRVATSHVPAGALEVAQADDSTVGLAMTANSSSALQMVLLKDSSGNSRFEVNAAGNSIHRATSFFTTSVQVGSASSDVGGGAGVISVKNAGTAPTSNPTGGVILYVASGRLKVRQPDGTDQFVALTAT